MAMDANGINSLDDNQSFSVFEVAEMINRKKETLKNWEKAGVIPPSRSSDSTDPSRHRFWYGREVKLIFTHKLQVVAKLTQVNKTFGEWRKAHPPQPRVKKQESEQPRQ